VLGLLAAVMPVVAQPTAPKSVLGTVSGFKAETAEMMIKPDTGEAVTVKLTPDTAARRIAPGEKDLNKAQTIPITDVAVGDRVLVSLSPNFEARRVVVMSASDIAKRNEADRLDWARRGAGGVVTAKSSNSLTLTTHTFSGEKTVTVEVDEKTKFRRYAPDSVKFADALPSSLSEIQTGDQVRARGQKSEDGLKLSAEELVFGTFLTQGGTITAINPNTREITIKSLTNNKPILIKLVADTQIKRMGMPGGGMAGGAPGGMRPGAGPMGGGGGPGGGRGGDIAQMLERMPTAKLDDMHPGETIVISSTKGAKNDQVTAITIVANADMLIQIASRTRATQRQDQGVSLAGGGFGGLDLPGITP